jgi:hypothetical protein
MTALDPLVMVTVGVLVVVAVLLATSPRSSSRFYQVVRWPMFVLCVVIVGVAVLSAF